MWNFQFVALCYHLKNILDFEAFHQVFNFSVESDLGQEVWESSRISLSKGGYQDRCSHLRAAWGQNVQAGGHKVSQGKSSSKLT